MTRVKLASKASFDRPFMASLLVRITGRRPRLEAVTAPYTLVDRLAHQPGASIHRIVAHSNRSRLLPTAANSPTLVVSKSAAERL
jgi:hypothetical protein